METFASLLENGDPNSPTDFCFDAHPTEYYVEGLSFLISHHGDLGERMGLLAQGRFRQDHTLLLNYCNLEALKALELQEDLSPKEELMRQRLLHFCQLKVDNLDLSVLVYWIYNNMVLDQSRAIVSIPQLRHSIHSSWMTAAASVGVAITLVEPESLSPTLKG